MASTTTMHAITIISFVAFTALAGFLTWLITRKSESGSSDGFFLGGRSLTFPVIAGSLLLTNLSTEQMVGLNGAAFAHGFQVMAWEVVAGLSLVLMAIYFLPKFLKSGITTVPQFLELRYGKTTQNIANTIFLAAYAVILIPIILYTGAQGLMNMMDLKALTGISDDRTILIVTVIGIGVLGAIYSRLGNLKTLATLDTINGVGLLIGGFMILFFALNKVSGGEGFMQGWSIIKEAHPERLNSIGGPKDELPFSVLFTGVALLNLFYWCTNQQIIQRTFGASSLAEGQKGVLLTGALKLLGPLYLVIPGIIAYHLYKDAGLANDQAYGTLVKDVLPPQLTGFFAAVMVGAILSSFNAALNSTSALFSLGLYKNLKPNGSETQMVKSAKIFVICAAVAGMIIAPILATQDSIFGYLQAMNAIYFIPLFSVILAGLLFKNVPNIAGVVGLVFGLVCILGKYIIEWTVEGAADKFAAKIHNFHYLGLIFALSMILIAVIGVIKPRKQPWELRANNEIDMTPWKGAPIAGALLVIAVLAIYLAFADFSVLGGGK